MAKKVRYLGGGDQVVHTSWGTHTELKDGDVVDAPDDWEVQWPFEAVSPAKKAAPADKPKE